MNRVLVSGLILAGSIASNVELRRESRRLAGQIEEQVSAISLNAAVMSQAEAQLTRLTKNYQPAISIIQLLVESQGIALEGDSVTSRLPGFMLDMNAFFQALRVASENRNTPSGNSPGEANAKAVPQSGDAPGRMDKQNSQIVIA